MRIRLKLYASLSVHLPANAEGHEVDLEVGKQASPIEILTAQGIPLAEVHLLLINGVFIPPSERNQPLKPNDELAVWPAVAGG